MENNAIHELLAEPLDEITIKIGIELDELRQTRRAFPPTKPELKELAEKYIDRIWSDLKGAICNEENLRSIKKHQTEIGIVSAISDLIASVIVGISPITVAVLIYMYGIDNICTVDE